MKITTGIIPIIGAAAMALPLSGAEPKLPKVEILGKEYYYHEIKKGESIYGIAKQYGWDINELVRLNPNTSSDMEKGSRLYYPTGRVTVVKEVEETSEPADTVSYEPIRHVVKKGETVYSISRQYNIPLATIYAAYPNAKYGIKAGETLELQQTPETVADKYLFYVIKPGDTLYSLSQKYNTSVEDILKANPGVTERNFRIGDTVRLSVNSGGKRVHTELVEEERLASLDSYKVKKNDTWGSIAETTGVPVATLKEANEDVAVPKKDRVLNVPVMETVTVEKETEYVAEEPEPERIQEIYDSVHNVNSDTRLLDELRVAMLSDEPTSKKDLEFARGFLIALDELKSAPYKINFKLIDGRASTDAVTDELDGFEPNLIVATADKAFPAFLADYGNTNNVEIVNVFDVKNELYEDNQSMVQILPSSAYFNEQMADKIYDEYSGRELLLVGVADDNDGIAELLVAKYPEDKVKRLSVNSLSEYTVTDNGSYLIYAYPSRKEEVADVMKAVSNLRELSPVAEINVVGRPSWVTLVETLGDKFGDANVEVPSRLWLDTDTEKWKAFSETYSEMFGGSPLKSFPNFAASGYDIAKFFLPSTAENGGDFNKGFSGATEGSLQADIKLERVNNWGGFFNPTGYLLRFLPGGMVEKVLVR